MATDEYLSSFSGQQVDDALTKATTALQPSDILDTSGINTNKAISQNACTNLFNQFIYSSTNPNPTPAQNATNVTSTINGVAISSIFETDATTGATLATVKNATNATNLLSGGTIASNVTATTQDASDNSQRVATTAYVTRAVNAIKNIDSGDISVSSSFVSSSSITSATVKRQADIVVMNLQFSFSQTSWSTEGDVLVALFPLDFVPPSTLTFYALFEEHLPIGTAFKQAFQVQITSLGQIILTLQSGSIIQSATSFLLCCGYSMN